MTRSGDYRQHPPAMWKDMLKVDLWKTMKRMVAMQPDFRGFATHLPLGSPAPDFLLRDAAGQEQRLSALRGKVVVLEFGALT